MKLTTRDLPANHRQRSSLLLLLALGLLLLGLVRMSLLYRSGLLNLRRLLVTHDLALLHQPS